MGRTGSRLALRLLQLGQRRLVLIDRDYLEQADVESCPLYSDAKPFELKAPAAKAALAKRFPDSLIAAITANLDPSNAREILGKAAVICDDTDNWGARSVIARYCWKQGLPWVYCGALGRRAMVGTLIAGSKPCWFCWNPLPQVPVACSVAGLDLRVASAAANTQASEAVLLAKRGTPQLSGRLRVFDSPRGAGKTVALVFDPACKMCGGRVAGNFAAWEQEANYLCGNGQYQFFNRGLPKFSPKAARRKLAGLDPRPLGILTQLDTQGAKAMLFPDGRVLVRAKTLRAAAAANRRILNSLGKRNQAG